MSGERDVLRLALDVFEARLVADNHLPEEQRIKLARAAAERVVDAGAPQAVAWLEKQRPRTVVNELLRPALMKRARPYIDTVLREANATGDVSERMLLTSAIPWVVPHRHRLCWLLSRDDGMTEEQIAVVLGPGRTQGGVSKAIDRHVARMTRELAASEAEKGQATNHGR